MRLLIAVLFALLLSACTTPNAATPEVIPNNSVAQTRTAVARPPAQPTPGGPTATPYARPTDPPALKLDEPIVRVGSETITLGQFRNRVRYERYAALDSVRQIIERLGLQRLKSGPNPSLDNVLSVFNTLSNADGFGAQVYDIMIREAIIRQEFNARGLKVNPKDVRAFWIRVFELQNAPDVDAVLPGLQEAAIARAMSYSGLSRDAINQIVETSQMSDQLRPLVVKGNVKLPGILRVTYQVLVAQTEAEAQAALARVNKGEAFHTVACDYSAKPGLDYNTRTGFAGKVSQPEQLFAAEKGDLVGPLEHPMGWAIYRVVDKRKNSDGDTEAGILSIVVATQARANELKTQAQQGADFAQLSCLYSLDMAGHIGDISNVDADDLPDPVWTAVKSAPLNTTLGPFKRSAGYELYFLQDRRVVMQQPKDLEKAEAEAYVAWQQEKLNSSYVVKLSESWRQAIPADPLPREVSPLMVEQNFGLPTPIPTPKP